MVNLREPCGEIDSHNSWRQRSTTTGTATTYSSTDKSSFILRTNVEAATYIVRSSLEKLIEGMEVVVSGLLADHAGLLQQVVVDVATHGITLQRKSNKIIVLRSILSRT